MAATDSVVSEQVVRPPSIVRAGNPIARYWPQAVVIALAVLLWAPRLTGPIDLRWDAGVYYVLGTSLATGQGYRILSEPGSPKALQYPPLLPAFVALHERALGSTDPAVVGPWLRVSYAVLFLAYGLAALALARNYLPAGLAIIVVGLSLLQVNTLFNSDMLFTEVPFGLISVLFVLVAVSSRLASRPWLRESLLFALGGAAFLLRTAGIALLGAWVVESFLRRQWRLAFVRCLLAAVPILVWQAHVIRVRSSYEYSHPAYEYQRAPYQFYNVSYAENAVPGSGEESSRANALAKRIAINSAVMAKRLGEAVSSSQGYWKLLLSRAQQVSIGKQLISPKAMLLPILALSATVLAGLGLLVYRRSWFLSLVVVISLGLICTTPWPGQFQRYLVPITPFLAIALVMALYAAFCALRQLPARRGAVLGQASVAALLLLAVVVEVHAASEVFSVRQREGASFIPGRGDVGPRVFFPDLLWRGWEQAVGWISEHSSANTIVSTPYCHLFYLRTGRHAVSPPVEPDPARTRYLLESVPVSFVIVDRGYSLPAIEENAPGWHLVQSFDGTKVYQYSGSPNDSGSKE